MARPELTVNMHIEPAAKSAINQNGTEVPNNVRDRVLVITFRVPLSIGEAIYPGVARAIAYLEDWLTEAKYG